MPVGSEFSTWISIGCVPEHGVASGYSAKCPSPKESSSSVEHAPKLFLAVTWSRFRRKRIGSGGMEENNARREVEDKDDDD
eukprot:752932-Hanusia_phi.AAC.8